jgi:hypothetical protein
MDKKPASIIDKIKNTLLIFCNIAYAIELIAAYVLFNMRF